MNDPKDSISPLFERGIGVHSKSEIQQLNRSKVAIVGIGCDGCEVAEQLIRTGVNEITLIDGDKVEESNLNRQRLFSYSDIGTPKVFAAKKRLQDISPKAVIHVVDSFLQYENIDLLKGHDVIVQGLDNIPARILVHELAKELSIPSVTMTGQPPLRSVVSTILPDGPTYQELFSIELEKPLRQMTKEERRKLHNVVCLERAAHALKQGADKEWYENFTTGKTSWSITLGRSPVTGTLQTNEVIRILLGKKPLAIAPTIVAFDGNGLHEFGYSQDVCKILHPQNSKGWDYRLF